MNIGPLGVSCCIWHQDFCSESFGLYMLGVGPPWVRPVLACPTDSRSDWNLGNLEAWLPWALFCVLFKTFLSRFCGVAGSSVLLGGPLPLERTIAIKRCSWSTTVFWRVVNVKCNVIALSQYDQCYSNHLWGGNIPQQNDSPPLTCNLCNPNIYYIWVWTKSNQ